MPVDFAKLASAGDDDPIIDTRQLFASLPLDRSKYPYMRDVQGEVLERWFDRRSERDLVIKMNTGGGKTVVGLLALQSSLNEGIGPALYLTPDNYLAEQVTKEAQALGIAVTDDPRSPEYHASEAICVNNVYKLFNGRTVFGRVSSSSRIPIGTVLVDDAHACLESVRQQFALDIPATSAAYDHILKVLYPALSEQARGRAEELRREDPSANMAVPPWAWFDAQDKIMPHLVDAAAEIKSVGFNWPLVRDVVHLCRVAVSTQRIHIAPPCLPVAQIPSFTNAKRRLYLSATLADDSDLVTDFGADPTSVARPIVPTSAADIGDRLILSPMETLPGLDHTALRKFIKDLSASRNSVVLASSDSRARQWEDVADRICTSDTIAATVEELRTAHLGLVVLSNRYDGIDLPGTACEILVVDGLPTYSSPLDRIDAEMIDGTERVARLQMQRIEQGMGRGVRSSNDSCVVLLSDVRLASEVWIHGADHFSPATAAQLKLSRKVAAQAKGSSLDDYRDTIDLVLNRDPAWISASRGAVARVVSPTESDVAALSIARREAFDAAEIGDIAVAVERISTDFNKIDENPLRGWAKQQAASYLYTVDRAAADKLQGSARKDNRSAFRPVGMHLSSSLLKASRPQADAAASYLESQYGAPSDVLLGVETLISRLQPDPTKTRDFERAMADYGQHLGFATSRPEDEDGTGPDVLWALGDGTYFVIECKSGAEVTAISKTDLGQLGHSIDWFDGQYPNESTAVPVMIHPAQRCGNAAVAAAGTRVITFEVLDEITDRLRQFASAVSTLAQFDTTSINERLTTTELIRNGFRDRWTRPIKPA